MEKQYVFSAPGRTEIGGNHTDHQRGCVLAAAVDLETVAIVWVDDSSLIQIDSEGYPLITVDLNELDVREDEKNTTASLIRGMASAFVQRGAKLSGFRAKVKSTVLPGSGLSSSAAFEVLIGTILNELFFDKKLSAIEIAQIGQYAENVYFGKPCGLMDQTACAVGGFITIDFNDTENPIIEKVPFDFNTCGHSLCIVDTGADHADLTDAYAAVKNEMQSVASYFGKSFLRELDYEDFLGKIKEIRKEKGDRAVMRALHFFEDNIRVDNEIEALRNSDFEAFKKNVIESGNSSFMYNQNVSTFEKSEAQPVAVALAVTESILKNKGAWRVHGGGFAGTIQAFVPNDMLSEYKTKIEKLLGEGSCYVLAIRPVGGSIVF